MVVKELRLQLTVASLRLTVSVSCYLSLTITKIRDSRGTLDIFMEDEEGRGGTRRRLRGGKKIKSGRGGKRKEEDGAYIVCNLVYFSRVEFHAASAVAGLLRNERICLILPMT